MYCRTNHECYDTPINSCVNDNNIHSYKIVNQSSFEYFATNGNCSGTAVQYPIVEDKCLPIQFQTKRMFGRKNFTRKNL